MYEEDEPAQHNTSVRHGLARLLHGRTVAVAESCTAGRISVQIAAEDGASAFFLGGVSAYHERTKRSLLAVVAPCIYSEEAAAQMAEGVAHLTTADVSVATTGVAGPEPVDGVAPGTVCIAALVDGTTRTRTFYLDGTAEEICDGAASAALDMLEQMLSASNTGTGSEQAVARDEVSRPALTGTERP